MKKSVVILILIIYIGSIVCIGFFGMKIKTYEEMIYVTKIEITNEEIIEDREGRLTAVIDYFENDKDPPKFQLEWHTYPDVATNKIVTFLYDDNSTVAYVNKGGTVIFNKKGTISVTIQATDGSNVTSKQVKIIAK